MKEITVYTVGDFRTWLRTHHKKEHKVRVNKENTIAHYKNACVPRSALLP